ncbi:hypothetical protein ACROYT_G020232 [Oculina patagonica]
MTPQDVDYLLTMSDISRVQLRAKLVVLSCCHSGRGQIRAVGVIGIARAFLGSGARSVLVALWALGDSATKQLKNNFYEHLAHGESASESLHEAMKWMRDNGFPKIADWAPFVLIGDNVTFDFGKEKRKTVEGEPKGELESHKKFIGEESYRSQVQPYKRSKASIKPRIPVSTKDFELFGIDSSRKPTPNIGSATLRLLGYSEWSPFAIKKQFLSELQGS